MRVYVGMSDSLWQSLSNPWQSCLEEAWAAYCAGSLPIGSVVTDPSGQILSRGRNRIFGCKAEGRDLSGHRLAHAEMNALLALDHARIDARSCTLYTTCEPCPLCVGALRVMRVQAVHYGSRDPVGGSMALLEATPFMRRAHMAVFGPPSPMLENMLMALMIDRELTIDSSPRWSLAAWESKTPLGVRLGRTLYETGELRRRQNDATPVHVVVDSLANRLASTVVEG